MGTERFSIYVGVFPLCVHFGLAAVCSKFRGSPGISDVIHFRRSIYSCAMKTSILANNIWWNFGKTSLWIWSYSIPLRVRLYIDNYFGYVI